MVIPQPMSLVQQLGPSMTGTAVLQLRLPLDEENAPLP